MQYGRAAFSFIPLQVQPRVASRCGVPKEVHLSVGEARAAVSVVCVARDACKLKLKLKLKFDVLLDVTNLNRASRNPKLLKPRAQGRPSMEEPPAAQCTEFPSWGYAVGVLMGVVSPDHPPIPIFHCAKLLRS